MSANGSMGLHSPERLNQLVANTLRSRSLVRQVSDSWTLRVDSGDIVFDERLTARGMREL